MGKQVEFYFTCCDENSFLEEVAQLQPVSWRRAASVVETESAQWDLPSVESDPDTVNLVLFDPTQAPKVFLDEVPTRSLTVVDMVESEVVQYVRCTSFRGWLVAGRLWYEPRSLHGPKSPTFLAWADRILRLLRRSCVRHSDGRFVGKDALARAASGQLTLGPPVVAFRAH